MAGGQLPTQILADQKAPPGSGGALHYYLPTQIQEATYAPDTEYKIAKQAENEMKLENRFFPLGCINDAQKQEQ